MVQVGNVGGSFIELKCTEQETTCFSAGEAKELLEIFEDVVFELRRFIEEK